VIPNVCMRTTEEYGLESEVEVPYFSVPVQDDIGKVRLGQTGGRLVRRMCGTRLQ
jgi:hypothetical protein